ncbi:MAG TPA: hypothetical protein DDX92_02290 [Flavobacteriales bacterium]|jgi:hypothetical protein|nr:hypothetical protein [Flavobacteriales bacterium]
MKRILHLLFILPAFTYGQEIRLGVAVQASSMFNEWERSLGELTVTEPIKTGIDISIQGAYEYKTNLFLGYRFGYTLYSLDVGAIEEKLYPQDPSSVAMEYNPYQNINFMMGIGYRASILSGKVQFLPHFYGGLNSFKSPFLTATYPDQAGTANLQLIGDVKLGWILMPGIEIDIPLSNLLYLSLNVNSYIGNYDIEEEIKLNGYNQVKEYKLQQSYQLRTLNFGAGILVVL